MSANPAIKDFDLNLIKVLDAVINAGNATKASKRLKVTPGAVSQALQRLQNAYSEELFIRTREGLTPTTRAREIHSAYSQALEIIAFTLEHPPHTDVKKEITIMGNDINEQYYFSQLFDFEPFTRYFLNYCSAPRHNEQYREALTGGSVDLVLSTRLPDDPEIETASIEHFRDYCVVCSQHNPLAELTGISVYHFFAFQHAVYRPAPWTLSSADKVSAMFPEVASGGMRRVGYSTDSINGLISIVENSSCIAVLPYRLARFFQIQKKLNIVIMSLPEELNFTSQMLYASWHRKNRHLNHVKEIVAMLQTLSSFRKW
ncbi:LysR family transcriptional regulator [Siccibacter turicensis]|uniref:LysR family transcriptional regulator n=1 Tax=Siccibacter turicensis TaxID=357233 RepID=UPI000463EC29|nr:LysR family transcriptional regulator [Siccibacter turicensis]